MWGILDILRMANDGDRFLDSMSEFNSNVVGEFRLIDGQLYLDKDGNQTLALPILSSGEYDHTALEQYIPLLGVWGRTATYIHSNSTHSTFRAEFDPAQVDWPGAGLDAAGIVADTLSLGLAGRFTNASKIAYGAGKVIGQVDLAYGAVQAAQQPSFSSGAGLTSDFIGLYVPIIPDIFGLLLNFGNAFHFYP